MAFGDRYRQRDAEKPKVEEKPVEIIVKERTIEETVKEEFPKSEVFVIEPKIKIVRKNRPFKKKSVTKVEKFISEFKDPVPTIKEKDGVEDKKYVNIALNGNTVECNDFRAIVKKKGLKITDVLTKIIKEWNAANYNF